MVGKMSALEIGFIVPLGLIGLLAIFGPKIRRAYLKARNDMRKAAQNGE